MPSPNAPPAGRDDHSQPAASGFISLKRTAHLAAFILGSVFFMPTVSDAVFGLALLLAFVALPDKDRLLRQLSGDRLLWCAGLLLLYLGFSSLWSPDLNGEELIKMALRVLFLFTFLAIIASGMRDLTGFHLHLGRYIVLGVLLSTLICLFWFYAWPPEDGRMTGINRFNNTGRAGRMIAAALPFTLACLWLDRGIWKKLGLISLAVCIFGLFQTGTRSAWMTAGVSLALYALLALEQRPRRIATALAGLLVTTLVAGGFILANPELQQIVFPRGDSFRFDIWSGHWRDILEHASPFGWGILTDHSVIVGAHEFRGAHNMYLSVAGHIGLPGLGLFLVLLAWTAQRLFTHIHLPQARLGLCLIVAGCAMFIFNGDRLINKVNFVWFVVWLPLALALSLSPAGRNETSDPGFR